MNTEQIQAEEKRLLDFCHFLGGSGYKINGYDDSQLLVIIGKFFHAYGRSAGLEREKEYQDALKILQPYVEDLQMDNHNEPGARLRYDYELERGIRLMYKCLGIETWPNSDMQTNGASQEKPHSSTDDGKPNNF